VGQREKLLRIINISNTRPELLMQNGYEKLKKLMLTKSMILLIFKDKKKQKKLWGWFCVLKGSSCQY